MNREQSRKKYLMKKLENPLPPLQEDERIYFDIWLVEWQGIVIVVLTQIESFGSRGVKIKC